MNRTTQTALMDRLIAEDAARHEPQGVAPCVSCDQPTPTSSVTRALPTQSGSTRRAGHVGSARTVGSRSASGTCSVSDARGSWRDE